MIVSGIAQGCIYGMIALGFVMVYKATEILNFAQGDFMMLGAFLGVTFITLMNMPYWLGFVLTIVCMALIGYLLDLLILRRVIGQPTFALVILTISLGFVIRALAGGIWGGDPKSISTPYSGKLLNIGSAIIAYEQIAVIAGTVILTTLLYVFFRFSKMGVVMQATSQNQLAAYYMGIPVKMVLSLIIALSAAVSAIAGILLAPISMVDTELGFMGIKAFAAAVIGGFVSLPGVLLGGILVGLSEQFASIYLPQGVSPVIAYIMMIVVLVIRPEGLFSKIHRKKV